MLKSAAPQFGLAIIAHEIGHLVHNHTKRNINSLEAQFEADQFVLTLGLENELIATLSEYRHIYGINERIEQLTRKKAV